MILTLHLAKQTTNKQTNKQTDGKDLDSVVREKLMPRVTKVLLRDYFT